MSDWPLRVMIYGAGEAINGSGALANQIQAQLGQLESLVTNRYIAAIAQLDSSNVATRRYVLDPSKRQPVYQLPNVDVGDPAALIDFAMWSVAVCPAKRSVLVLSGHGAAWEDSMVANVLAAAGSATRSVTAVPGVPGAIHHARSLLGARVSPTGAATRAILIDGHDRDFLSNAELGSACSKISLLIGGKIDVLVMDACLMSSCEILHELSDSASTVVASIDELSAAGIDISSVVRRLSASGAVADANAIAEMLARDFQPKTAFDTCVAIDLANPAWASAVYALRRFCTTVLPWLQASAYNAEATRAALRAAATSLVQFVGGGLADVKAFAAAMANIPGLPASAADDVRSAVASLEGCILARSTGRDYQSASGLSIFAPGSVTTYRSNRSDYMRLQFSSLTGWGAVLDMLYGGGGGLTRFVHLDGETWPTPLPSVQDAEFVVSLRGLPVDMALRNRIEKAIQRTVLEVLASIDLLGDVNVTSIPRFARTRGLRLPIGLGTTSGLVVVSNQGDSGGTRAPVATPRPVPTGSTIVEGSGPEFRVVLRGLALDEVTKQRIDAAIRSAVLEIIATIDHGLDLHVRPVAGDPDTRSLLGDIGRVLGMWLGPIPEL